MLRNFKMQLYTFILVFCFNFLIASVVSYKDALQDAGDLMVQHLIEKYKDPDHSQFWHPHVSEPGRDDNREVIKISEVEKFSLPADYIQWKHTRLGLNNYLLGLSNHTLDIFLAVDMKKVHTIRVVKMVNSGFIGSAEEFVTFTAFTKWDEENYRSEMIIALGTSKPGVEVFRATHDELKLIGYFPLNYQVKDIQRCQALTHTRLLLIPRLESDPVELYGLETSFINPFWYFQRLDVHIQSAVCYELVPAQSVIAVASHNASLIRVYYYDSSGLYNLHQEVKVEYKCLRLFSFSLSYKHFLGCVPEPHQHIQFLCHTGGIYSHIPTLGDFTAVTVYAAPIQNYRDEPILFIQDIKGDTHILHYDGIKHIFSIEYDCRPGGKCLPVVDLFKGASYQDHNGTTIFVSPTDISSGHFTILVVHTTIEYGTHSPVYRESRQLYQMFETEHKRLATWKETVTHAAEVLDNSLSLSGENIVTGSWTFSNTLSGAHIKMVNESSEPGTEQYVNGDLGNSMKKFVFVNQDWTARDFHATREFGKVDAQIEFLVSSLHEMKHIMADALLKNSSELQIVQKPTIVKGRFTSSELYAANVWVDHLWETEDTEQFLNSLYIRDFPEPQEIIGTIVFNKRLSMDSMHVELYNGVEPKNVARLFADNVFRCPLEFHTKFTAKGNIHAPSVEGYNLTEQLVMINDIRGCTFEDGLVARTTTIDDLDFNFNDILLKSKDQTIKSDITFEEVRTKNGAFVKNVNGYQFKHFIDSIVLDDYTGFVEGDTKISGKLRCDKIQGMNRLNQIPFPGGYVKNNQHMVNMTGMKNFTHVTADQVYVSGMLNGVHVDNMWVGLSAPMKINSTWVFSNNVETLRDLIVTERVNGIDLQDLKHHETMDKMKEGYVIHSDVEFTKPVVFNILNVQSKINGKTHEEMFHGVLIFDGPECRIPHETVVDGSLHLHDLHVATGEINMQPLNSLVTINTPQEISGHMTFAQDTFFKILHTEIFDSVPLSSFFDRTIRLTNPAVIHSNLRFENLLCGGNFSSHGLINNYETFRTLVAVTSGRESQVFQGNKYIFDHLVAGDLEVTNNLNMEKGKTIGGVDLVDWYNSRIRLDLDQSIPSPVIFHGRGVALKNINVESINGVSLDELANATLRNDKSIHIFSDAINIDKLFVNGKVVWKENVSGYSLDEVRQHALPLHSEELHIINSNWEFESMTISGMLTVHGSTCGVNIPFLNTDIVKKGENHVTISGEKVFKEMVNVQHTLEAKSLNGDPNFFQNLISLHDPVVFNEHVNFRKNLVIKNELLMEYLNEVSIRDLCQAYSFENGTHVIRHNLDILGELIGHNLQVNGLYQDESISEAFSEIVKTSGPPIKINSIKVFDEPAHFRGEFSAIKINGIDLMNLAKNLIMTNQPYTFHEPVVFKNVVADRIIVNGSQIESKYLPNNENLGYLSQNAIYINGNIPPNTVPYSGLRFQDISLQNNFYTDSVNGHPVENYIRLNDPDQFIPHLAVENARFSGPNVFVKNNVGGLNIPREHSNTLMIDSPTPQHVRGNTTFTNNVNVKGNLICKNENMPQNPNDVVTFDKDSTIHGPVVFKQPVHVKYMTVTNKVAGRTMDEYLSEPLRKTGDQEIPESWNFNGGVKFENDVIGNGKLDDYDLKTIIDDIKHNITMAEKEVDKDLQAFYKKCAILDSITRQLTETSMKLDYFDTHQSLPLRKQVEKVITVETKGELVLLVFLARCEVPKYIWSREQEEFYELQPSSSSEQKLGNIKDAQTLSWNGLGLLVYSTHPSDCVTSPEGLYIVAVDETGRFSTPNLIFNTTIVDFKITNIKGRFFMVVVTNASAEVGQKVIILSWHPSGKFIEEKYLYLTGPLRKLELTQFQQGIAFLLQTPYGIFTYYYDIESKGVSLVGFAEYLVKLDSSMIIFNNNGALYIIVQERAAGESLIKPAYSLQVFRIYNGKTLRVQTLEGGDVVSTNILHVSNNEILISVISKRAAVMFFKFMGLSGFQPFYSNPIKIFDAKQIHFFNIMPWMYNVRRPFFVLVAKNSITIYHSTVFGSAMLRSYEHFPDICSIK